MHQVLIDSYQMKNALVGYSGKCPECKTGLLLWRKAGEVKYSARCQHIQKIEGVHDGWQFTIRTDEESEAQRALEAVQSR